MMLGLLWFAWIGGLGSGDTFAWAQSGDAYLRRLSLMDAAVNVRAARSLPESGATPAARLALPSVKRAFFSPGQHWTVEFTPRPDARARMSAHDEDLTARQISPHYFDFKVQLIDAQGRAHLEIRERDAREPGSRMRLVVDETFRIVEREEFRGDFSLGVIPAASVGNGSAMFEGYPAELPDLSLARGEPLREVPPQLRRRLRMDSVRALDLRYEDLLSRPVRAIWVEGEPWPLFVGSSAGTAVVVTVARGGA